MRRELCKAFVGFTLALPFLAGCGSGTATDPGTSASSGAHAASSGVSSSATAGAGGTGGGAGGASTSTASAGGASSSSSSASGTGGAGAGGGASASSSSSSSSASATSGAGGGGAAGTPCSWPGTCDDGLYCKSAACGAGTCTAKPVVVSNVEGKVCGCDHVTYWNEATAASQGASVLASGECPGAMAITCDAATPCPSGLRCNRKVSGEAQCTATVSGVCWGVPAACPLGGAQAKACNPVECATECTLVQSQNDWFDDGTCQ